jgi:hypothetical protein
MSIAPSIIVSSLEDKEVAMGIARLLSGGGAAVSIETSPKSDVFQAIGTVAHDGRYFDPDDKPCTAKQHADARNSADPVRRRYQNWRIRISLIWWGINDSPKVVPRDQAPLWLVEVCDRVVVENTTTGEIQEKFTEAPDSKTFARREQAERYFESILERFTSSVRRDDGTLKEVDNELAPPDPDVPVSVGTGDDAAW